MQECAHSEFKANTFRAAIGFRCGWALVTLPFIIPVLMLWAVALTIGPVGSIFGLIVLMPVLLGLLGIHFALMSLANRKRAIGLTFTERGIGIQTLFSGRREVSWDSIREIKYVSYERTLVIKTKHDKFIVGTEIEGFDSICERLSEKREQALIRGPVSTPGRKRYPEIEAPHIVAIAHDQKQEENVESI